MVVLWKEDSFWLGLKDDRVDQCLSLVRVNSKCGVLCTCVVGRCVWCVGNTILCLGVCVGVVCGKYNMTVCVQVWGIQYFDWGGGVCAGVVCGEYNIIADRIYEADGFQNIKLGLQFRTLKQEITFSGTYTVLLVKCIVRPKLKTQFAKVQKAFISETSWMQSSPREVTLIVIQMAPVHSTMAARKQLWVTGQLILTVVGNWSWLRFRNGLERYRWRWMLWLSLRRKHSGKNIKIRE